MNKLRIVSQGLGSNTHVFTADGQELQGITSVKLTILPTMVVKAEITFIDVELEIWALDVKRNLTEWSDNKTKGYYNPWI